jgi:uncharacterized protein (DUF2235 family)
MVRTVALKVSRSFLRTREMKRLIVCCDGTWNDTDNQSTDTNVFLIAKAIHGSQETRGILQAVLYLRGGPTINPPDPKRSEREHGTVDGYRTN